MTQGVTDRVASRPQLPGVTSSQSLWIDNCDERLVFAFDTPSSKLFPPLTREQIAIDMVLSPFSEDAGEGVTSIPSQPRTTTANNHPTTVSSNNSARVSDLHAFLDENIVKKKELRF